MASASSYVRHIPSSALHVSKPTWWLESRFHFDLADYHSPSKTNFGALRVLNDDLVKGKSGFGKHPHRDAEIFSYVVDGRLTHQDSLGNSEALGRGAVQYMSAGTGVVHSELNASPETCRFVQTWITPDRRGHAPQYGSAQFAPADRRNRLLHILGGTSDAPAWAAPSGSGIRLHQARMACYPEPLPYVVGPGGTSAHDVNVMVCEADAAAAQAVALGRGRQAYLLAIEGSLEVRQPAGGGSCAAAPQAAAGGSERPAADSGAQCEPEGERNGRGAYPVPNVKPAEALAALDARDAAELVAPAGAELPLLLVPGARGAHFMLVEMARP